MGETEVAIKKLMSYWLLHDSSTTNDFERETEILKKLRHPNIVLFFGAGNYSRSLMLLLKSFQHISIISPGTLEDDVPFIVTEYLPMGSLTSVFKSLEPGTDFPMSRKLSFCIDAAAGMKYLHSLDPPHVHRDLKPQNLLVTSNWRVKIADFGTAKLLGSATSAENTSVKENYNNPLLSTHTTMIGTTSYMAPELMTKETIIYGTEVDVYRFVRTNKLLNYIFLIDANSFGLTMWVILSEEHRDPFLELDVR